MVRHVPWEDMPLHYSPQREHLRKKKKQQLQQQKQMEKDASVRQERTWEGDLRNIGLRVAFGTSVGFLSGGLLKTVEVMRDVKAMVADKRKTTASILRFAGQLGGFFGAYHGIRKTMELAFNQQWEDNIFFGSVIALSPLALHHRYRVLFPYGFVLICLDTFNEYQENQRQQ